MNPLFLILLLLTAGVVLPARAANPALERFAGEITFYASLDGRALAEFSEGSGVPLREANWSEEHWAPGLFGKALKSSAPAIHFEAGRNATLHGSGAVAFWVKALDWPSDVEPTALAFLRLVDGERELSLIRVWKWINRHTLAGHLKVGDRPHTLHIGQSGKWGAEWHLFVANWTRDYLEASLDGRPLTRQALSETTRRFHGTPAIVIPGGGSAGDFPYLIDEVIFFKRPLTSEEVQWLHTHLQPSRS